MTNEPDVRVADDSGFSQSEREAMRARAQELAQGRGGASRVEDLQSAIDAIAEMPEADRLIAERLHALVLRVAPDLYVKTWYGFPAYGRGTRGKDVVLFYTSSAKGQARYGVVGFTDAAALDDGPMWPSAYALTAWNAVVEATLESLVARANQLTHGDG